MLKRIIGLYFSPTDESAAITRGVADELARRLNEDNACEVVSEFYNLQALLEMGDIQFDEESVVVFGVPSIKNRIPMQCLRLMQHLHGGSTQAIAVVTSGGSYGNSLYDLYEFIEGQGFMVISAASFIAKNHSAPADRRLRARRPDRADLDMLSEFCRVSSGKLQRLGGCDVAGMQVKPAPLDITAQRKPVLIGRLKRKDPEWFL